MNRAKRIDNIPPYLFAGLEERATRLRAEGIDLIDLGIADPDLKPPDFLRDALIRHLDDHDAHRYPTSRGDGEVRAAVCRWFEGRFGSSLDPESEVAITIGAKEALANLARGYVNPGDEVGVPDPAYPVYANGAAILNDGAPRFLRLDPERGFLPDLGEAEGVRLLYLNYPNNPTGAVAPESFYRNVADFAESNQETLVIWDAAYCELCFDGFRPPSILNYTRRAVEMHSLSKMMNCTGYRIGFAAGDGEAIETLVKVKTQLDSGAPVFIQRAMAEALDHYKGADPPEEALRSRNEYGERKRMMEEGLAEVSGVIKVHRSPATFFIWAEVEDDMEFVERAIEKGVILTPGRGFGASGEGFVRVAVTSPGERIAEAVERLKSF